jgi:hypothetical protein
MVSHGGHRPQPAISTGSAHAWVHDVLHEGMLALFEEPHADLDAVEHLLVWTLLGSYPTLGWIDVDSLLAVRSLHGTAQLVLGDWRLQEEAAGGGG